VKPSFVICACVIAMVVSSCSKANASGFDPTNPLHCAAQFSTWEIVARKRGEERKALALGARAQWYAVRARSDFDKMTPAQVLDFSNRIAAQPDGGLALAKACWERQDADPEFQKLLRQK
jgi:hypothetical protein